MDQMPAEQLATASQPAGSEDLSRLALLYQVAEQVNSTLELDECLDRIIDGAYRIFGAEKVSLMLRDEDTDRMRIRAARNVPADVIARTEVRLGEGLSGKVAQSGEPLVVSDVEDDPRFRRKSRGRYRTGSFAIVPLRYRGRVLGVINLTNRADGTSFSQDDLALLTALANQAAIAIENSRLVAHINREKDQLRRRAFEADILYQVSSSIRYGLGYQHLIHVLSASLHHLLDYDLFCSLLVLNGDEDFETCVARKLPDARVAAVKRRLLDTLAARPHGPVVSERIEALRRELPDEPAEPAEDSIILVPLEVNDHAVGMMAVMAREPGAFSEADAELLHTIVRRMAETVERLQNILRGEQEKMQSMVASMTEGAVMFDANDELVVLNPRARAMLGLAPDQEFTTASFFRSIRWREIAAFLSEPAGEDGRVREFTIEDSAKPRTLSVALTPVRNARGEPLGRLAVLRDITRERELDQMKSDFVAMVSHELRTPLASIKMFTTNLLDGVEGEITEGQRETLSRMAKNLDRLARLINDLLDLSKLEAGKMKMALAPLDLRHVLQSVADVFIPTAADKDVMLEVRIPEKPPVLWADPDRLEQVLTNLLGNAVKFTPEGGRVVLDARARPPSPEERIAPAGAPPFSGEGSIVLSVSDTGPGIPEDDLENVFDKFYQTDHSMTRKTGGTGLGLPICKEIVEQHGGRIWAESTPGEGSTFHVELPVDGRPHDRESLYAAIDREIRRARRYGTPFGVLMLDIDDFTLLNQTLGYPNGDAALLQFQDMVRDEVKRFLQKRVRETDIVGRFGGDEFLVLAPETDKVGARAFAERLRSLVEEHRFRINDREIKATVSVGVAPFDDGDAVALDLVRRSAAALAEAKKAGKNTVR